MWLAVWISRRRDPFGFGVRSDAYHPHNHALLHRVRGLDDAVDHALCHANDACRPRNHGLSDPACRDHVPCPCPASDLARGACLYRFCFCDASPTLRHLHISLLQRVSESRIGDDDGDRDYGHGVTVMCDASPDRADFDIWTLQMYSGSCYLESFGPLDVDCRNPPAHHRNEKSDGAGGHCCHQLQESVIAPVPDPHYLLVAFFSCELLWFPPDPVILSAIATVISPLCVKPHPEPEIF
jgi:hypothetical protein